MEKYKLLSPCLLYSVAPESFSSLHLNNESGKDTFDWGADKYYISGDSLFYIVPNFLKITAAKWGLVYKGKI
jgi:hypothetical protein